MSVAGVPDACPVCWDNRWVEWTEDKRAYPCPYCGKFVVDEDKQFPLSKRRNAVKRYGNPFILSDMNYASFVHHRMHDDFKPYPISVEELTPEERYRYKQLCGTYPEAHTKFCLVWARYNP